MDKKETLTTAEKCLADFLLDIECLEPLAKYSSGVNVFDILRITKAEIRHSNMLAWLLNPNENHGLGDQFIRGVFQCISGAFPDKILDIFITGFGDFSVHREYHNIDLLLISNKLKIVLCIENKIDSDEHGNQLKNYQNYVTKEFPQSQWHHIFVFLSPDGRAPSNPEWIPLSYGAIVTLLQHCMEQSNLTPDGRMILEHYLKILKRDIVENNELFKICNEIYRKHQKALDLIFENRADSRSVVYGMIVDWCKEKAKQKEIIFDENFSNKSCIHFSTDNLNTIYSTLEKGSSGWGSAYPAFYEICNRDGKIRVICAVSSKNLSEKAHRLTQDIVSQYARNKDLKEDWEWKTIYSRSCYTVEKEDGKLASQEEISKYLDKSLGEIKEFEQKIFNLPKTNRSH